MFHDFTNVRKYVGGPPNTLGMFKNTCDACQLSNSTDILFALSIITGQSQRTNEYLPSSQDHNNKTNMLHFSCGEAKGVGHNLATLNSSNNKYITHEYYEDKATHFYVFLKNSSF